MSNAGPLAVSVLLVAVLVGLTFLVRRLRPHPRMHARAGKPAPWPPQARREPAAAPEPQPRETEPFARIVTIGSSEHPHVSVPRREGK